MARSDWLGFGERRWSKTGDEEVRPAKTLWDWLQLAVVPLAIAGIALVFNASQDAREQARVAQQAKVDRALAAQRTREDRALSAEAGRDHTLQAYLDRMQNLVLHEHLAQSARRPNVRVIARALTLSTLRRLDGRRKGEVVRFLAESGLIGANPAQGSAAKPDWSRGIAVDLRGADLRGAQLQQALLDNAALIQVDLEGATLAGASLKGAYIQHADLRGADADFTSFQGAMVIDAHLEGATFRHASMSRADFTDSCLTGADFTGADLRGAEFFLAEGTGIDLIGAALNGADFAGADLGRIVIDATAAKHAHVPGSRVDIRRVRGGWRSIRARALRSTCLITNSASGIRLP
jgi:uncharacterized protein YjbI with pentapeptide repeats